VVGALLFVQSFRKLTTLDPGFQAKGILLVSWSPGPLPAGRAHALERELLEEIRSIPGVTSAASTTNVLIGGGEWWLGVQAEGPRTGAWFTWVSPGYFRTLETPLLAGRDFDASDTEASGKVAIVNRSFVQRFLGGGNPIGKTFRSVTEPHYPETEYRVVGVARDTRYSDLRRAVVPMAYAPSRQNPADPADSLYVRSPLPLSRIASAIQKRVGQLHPELPIETRGFQAQIEDGLIRERLLAALSGFFGALAILLAAIGLYGLIGYMVARRRPDIGIRLALGAAPRGVLALVLKDVGILLAIGAGIGTLSSLALATAAQSLLFEISAHDPRSFLWAAGVLAAAGILGAWLPARRASRLDPGAALRCE